MTNSVVYLRRGSTHSRAHTSLGIQTQSPIDFTPEPEVKKWTGRKLVLFWIGVVLLSWLLVVAWFCGGFRAVDAYQAAIEHALAPHHHAETVLAKGKPQQ